MTRVWSDGLRLDVDSGGSIRADTWEVCGDSTPQSIAVGDWIAVFASWGLFRRDAWQVLDAEGEPTC